MEETVESENTSSLHTEKAVKGSYRMCQRHSFHRKQKDLRKKSRKGRHPSPDGEAPIYPTNPSDSEPECIPTEVRSSSGKCKVQVVLCLVAGYILGILLALIWYYQNPQRASTDLGGAWLLLIFFFLLLLIMLQRRPSRCIAVLCFPTLAHYQCRAVMVALAFLIALSGPVRNIIQNLNIMACSLSCGQSQLIDALRLMHRIISDPLQPMEESFQRVIDEMRSILIKLDKLFVKLEQPIANIYASHRTCASWLVLQNDYFDHTMGAPYTRCLRAGNLSIFQCQSEFGEPERGCCTQELFAWFCESLGGFKSFFGNNLQLPQIEDIFQRLQICFLKIRLMFIATISFDHSARPNTSVSLTDRDHIYNEEMKNHLEATRHKFFYVSFWLYLMVSILLLTVILRSIDFRVRYLMSDHFDNVYITKEFEVYEEQQSQIMGVQVLPLNSCEENKYVKIKSVKLLPNECKTMYRSGIFLFITGIQLYCLCLVDYSLYSMLVLMSLHGNETAGVQLFPDRKMVIEGGGKIGDILQDFVNAFEPKTFQMDSYNCHPVPGKPKYFRYFWISVLYVMAWIMVFWEPYGLRHRHRIMGYFYPEECKRRVRYLHYRILKDRKSALQRSCQRVPYFNFYLYENKLSCISYLSSLTNWFFGGCRVSFIGRSCTICSKRLTKSDYVFCASPNCPAVYCNMCLNESNNNCVLCSSPRECDFSEIGDSSDDWDYSYCSPDNDQCQ